jgi:hypothetical protein
MVGMLYTTIGRETMPQPGNNPHQNMSELYIILDNKMYYYN